MNSAELKMKPNISLCMITRDEEQLLPQCLESVKTLVNEIIILDTGSTDRTLEIAAAFGAKIYQCPWENDYSLHRNQSILHATGEWILVMDADEVIALQDLHNIQHTLNTVRADGFYFTLRNYVNFSNLANITLNSGDYMEGSGFPGYIGVDLIRLFRNDPQIYFTGQVHETVTQSINNSGKRVFTTGIPIHHYGKILIDRIKRKQNEYKVLGERRLSENTYDPMAYKGLCDQLLELSLPKDALDIADRGLGLFPDFIELHFDRGLALDRLGLQNGAEEEYLWVLAREPGHLGAAHNLALILFNKGQIVASMKLLAKIIERGMKHPAVFLLYGRALAASGETGKALENLEHILRVQPNYPDVNCLKAVIYLNNRCYPEAVEALEKEIEIGGNLVAAYNLLGEVSLFWKDKESAQKFFQKALRIDPGSITAINHLNRMS